MTETIAAQTLEHTALESPRRVQFSDGTVFWVCPRCGGYYPTQEQAAGTEQRRRSDAPTGPVVFEDETRRIELHSFRKQRRARSSSIRDLQRPAREYHRCR